jgi:hypothetical protein
MDLPLQGALSFVRLVAACCMVVGLLDTGMYVTKCLLPKQPAPVLQSNNSKPAVRTEHTAPVKISPIAVNSIPFVAGVVILIRAKAIANWISDKLE